MNGKPLVKEIREVKTGTVRQGLKLVEHDNLTYVFIEFFPFLEVEPRYDIPYQNYMKADSV